jgi:hypothetical protein
MLGRERHQEWFRVGGGVNMLLARRFENAIAVEATGS